MSEKSVAFDTFERFKMMVEKESRGVINYQRTDRVGEFNSSEFIDYCVVNGIRRQLIFAYTPQKNGVAERKNRNVMNMVKSQLTEAKLQNQLWPEAVSFYVINKCPTISVKDITPEEAWSDVKPSVKHFRFFGCVAYMHVPDVT